MEFGNESYIGSQCKPYSSSKKKDSGGGVQALRGKSNIGEYYEKTSLLRTHNEALG